MTPPSHATVDLLLFHLQKEDAHPVIELLEPTDQSYNLTAAKTPEGCLQLAEEKAFDLVILDLNSEESDGLETLEKLLPLVEPCPVIVLTSAQSKDLATRALKVGAWDYLLKEGLDTPTLERTIRRSIEHVALLRKSKADDALIRQNEALLRRIFEVNAEAMLILSTRRHQIKYLNPAGARLLDSRPEELLGAIFPFELRSGDGSELEIPGPDDSTSLVDISISEINWKGEDALLVVLRDITQHRKAQLALNCEKKRLALTLDAVADAVIAIAPDDTIEQINQEAARLLETDKPNAVGKALAGVLRIKHPKTGKPINNPVQWLLDTQKNGVSPERGLPVVDAKGTERFMSTSLHYTFDNDATPHGGVLVLRDMTRANHAEDDRFAAEKLNSINLLAAGIAHDFNNILTSILGNISLLRAGMDSVPALTDKLNAAEKATLQAKDLTQQLLTFSESGIPALETTALDQIVEECSQFILRGSNVRCKVSKDDPLWTVDADKGQIAQVVNNLLINADQAMPGGGEIHIHLSNETLKMDNEPSLPPGDYLRISVTDNGEGISPENLKRVFDPYFTTKSEGNGLGLASAYATVQSHHGAMTVQSTVGTGTTFSIYLPRSNESLPQPAPAAQPEDDTLHQGEGRILVMDDMEPMMMVAGEILHALGYEVELSTNGEEAIDAYKKAKEAGQPFKAVVFDLTVPGAMGGEDAAETLLRYDPALVAIASSGYTTSNIMSNYQNSAFKAVVPKPYRIKEMSDALRQAFAHESPKHSS